MKKCLNKSNTTVINPNETSTTFKKVVQYSVRQLWDDKNKIDVNPKYQRGLCWKNPRKTKFIKSLVSGAKVPPLSFIQKGTGLECDNYWVCDGKQRLEGTILAFRENQFSIPIKTSDDNKYNRLTWKSIESKANKGNLLCKLFVKNFNESSIDVNIYSPMSLEDQVVLFDSINEHTELSPNERLFSKNYILKDLCEHLFENTIKIHLGNNLQKRLCDKQNVLEGCKMVLDLIFLHFGTDFNQEYSSKSTKKIKHQAILMNDILKKLKGWNDDLLLDDETLKEAGLDNVVNSINNACKFLKIVFSVKPLVRYKKMDIFDFVLFFILMVREERFSFTFCENFKKEIFQLLMDYLKWKDDPDGGTKAGAKNHTNDGATIKIKMDQMMKIFKDFSLSNTDFDMGKKNDKFTEKEKQQAMLESNGICPLSGVPLDFTAEFDHKTSTKLTSNSKAQLVSPSANRVKDAIYS